MKSDYVFRSNDGITLSEVLLMCLKEIVNTASVSKREKIVTANNLISRIYECFIEDTIAKDTIASYLEILVSTTVYYIELELLPARPDLWVFCSKDGCLDYVIPPKLLPYVADVVAQRTGVAHGLPEDGQMLCSIYPPPGCVMPLWARREVSRECAQRQASENLSVAAYFATLGIPNPPPPQGAQDRIMLSSYAMLYRDMRTKRQRGEGAGCRPAPAVPLIKTLHSAFLRERNKIVRWIATWIRAAAQKPNEATETLTSKKRKITEKLARNARTNVERNANRVSSSSLAAGDLSCHGSASPARMEGDSASSSDTSRSGPLGICYAPDGARVSARVLARFAQELKRDEAVAKETGAGRGYFQEGHLRQVLDRSPFINNITKDGEDADRRKRAPGVTNVVVIDGSTGRGKSAVVYAAALALSQGIPLELCKRRKRHINTPAQSRTSGIVRPVLRTPCRVAELSSSVMRRHPKDVVATFHNLTQCSGLLSAPKAEGQTLPGLENMQLTSGLLMRPAQSAQLKAYLKELGAAEGVNTVNSSLGVAYPLVWSSPIFGNPYATEIDLNAEQESLISGRVARSTHVINRSVQRSLLKAMEDRIAEKTRRERRNILYCMRAQAAADAARRSSEECIVVADTDKEEPTAPSSNAEDSQVVEVLTPVRKKKSVTSTCSNTSRSTKNNGTASRAKLSVIAMLAESSKARCSATEPPKPVESLAGPQLMRKLFFCAPGPSAKEAVPLESPPEAAESSEEVPVLTNRNVLEPQQSALDSILGITRSSDATTSKTSNEGGNLVVQSGASNSDICDVSKDFFSPDNAMLLLHLESADVILGDENGFSAVIAKQAADSKIPIVATTNAFQSNGISDDVRANNSFLVHSVHETRFKRHSWHFSTQQQSSATVPLNLFTSTSVVFLTSFSLPALLLTFSQKLSSANGGTVTSPRGSAVCETPDAQPSSPASANCPGTTTPPGGAVLGMERRCKNGGINGHGRRHDPSVLITDADTYHHNHQWAVMTNLSLGETQSSFNNNKDYPSLTSDVFHDAIDRSGKAGVDLRSRATGTLSSLASQLGGAGTPSISIEVVSFFPMLMTVLAIVLVELNLVVGVPANPLSGEGGLRARLVGDKVFLEKLISLLLSRIACGLWRRSYFMTFENNLFQELNMNLTTSAGFDVRSLLMQLNWELIALRTLGNIKMNESSTQASQSFDSDSLVDAINKNSTTNEKVLLKRLALPCGDTVGSNSGLTSRSAQFLLSSSSLDNKKDELLYQLYLIEDRLAAATRGPCTASTFSRMRSKLPLSSSEATALYDHYAYLVEDTNALLLAERPRQTLSDSQEIVIDAQGWRQSATKRKAMAEATRVAHQQRVSCAFTVLMDQSVPDEGGEPLLAQRQGSALQEMRLTALDATMIQSRLDTLSVIAQQLIDSYQRVNEEREEFVVELFAECGRDIQEFSNSLSRVLPSTAEQLYYTALCQNRAIIDPDPETDHAWMSLLKKTFSYDSSSEFTSSSKLNIPNGELGKPVKLGKTAAAQVSKATLTQSALVATDYASFLRGYYT